MLKRIDDLRITKVRPLTSPDLLVKDQPITQPVIDVIEQSREKIRAIMHGEDSRLLVITGPCSIHDPIAAMEYAERLYKEAKRFSDELHIIMRVYFEKPRTTVGWKGLINDPDLDESFMINRGLHIARKLLLEINAIGLSCGTEFLDTVIPQYICDLISWGAIGARTTESQIHREMTSGLSMPVGFKNGTTGSIQVALDAILSAKSPHHFLGITKSGIPAIISTTGNPDGHLILRGSNTGANYDAASIEHTAMMLKKANLDPYIIVDCSHGNSEKDYQKQKLVAENLAQQIENGSSYIAGVMLESNLVAGTQKLHSPATLTYGQSITDSCIDFEETINILELLAKATKKRRLSSM